MRRPEGFDAPPQQEQPEAGRPRTRWAPKLPRAERAPGTGRATKRTGEPSNASEAKTDAADRSDSLSVEVGASADSATASRSAGSATAVVTPVTASVTASATATETAPATPPATARATASVRQANRELRRAEAERRRFERREVRRFTRRTRRRRIAWLTVGGAFVALLIAVAVAVFSPALAVKSIRVDGVVRVDGVALQAALDEQLGTPLALVDEGAIVEALEQFPLIRSFAIERQPPDSILVRISEREPIAAIARDDGYHLVDPAGVSVLVNAEPVEGVPVIDLRGQDVESVAFRSVVEVLLAMPADLRARVVEVAAASRDDVTLSLSGVGQTVAWGSADDSALKARVLATLMGTVDPGRAGQFDVSAPTLAIFRPA